MKKGGLKIKLAKTGLQRLPTQLGIFENQVDAGKQVVACYLNAVAREVILVAQMQSGKTGTAKYIVHHMLHKQDRVSVNKNSIYFICGMNDNDLRKQAIDEFRYLLPKRQILFSKQLERIVAEKHKKGSIACDLVIIDESHYASCKGSLVDKFLQLLKPTRFLLSVSATPMAELATAETLGKAVVKLTPGQGYYGIRDLFDNGLVFQAHQLSSEKGREKFVDLVCEQYERQEQLSGHKYNIVRLPSQWYYQEIEEELLGLELDICFINYHSGLDEREIGYKPEDFNSLVNITPDTFTIIWVYQSLRAGKQLNTSNIGFIYDTSNSRPDTIAQALMGRIFGYGKADHNVYCYTDLTAARAMLAWVEKDFDRCYVPKGSRHVVGGFNESRKQRWRLHPPILIELDLDDVEYYRYLKLKHGNNYPYKDEVYEDILKMVTPEEDPELVVDRVLTTYHPGKHGGLMVLTENNALKSFDSFWKYPYQCWKQGTPVRGFLVEDEQADGTDDVDGLAPGCYHYIFLNLNNLSPQYGNAMIIYKESLGVNGAFVEAEHIRLNQKSRFAIPPKIAIL